MQVRIRFQEKDLEIPGILQEGMRNVLVMPPREDLRTGMELNQQMTKVHTDRALSRVSYPD